MRSWVRCGIDFAAGDRLMTRDAAEASPCGREDEIVFDRAMGCMVDVVCHKQDCGGKRQGHFFSQVQQRYSCTSWAKNVRKIGLSLPGSSTMYSSFCLHS